MTLFDDRTEAFLQWLTGHAVKVSSKIEVADLRDSGHGRCVVARDDILEDEELFTIPRSAILNVETSSLASERAGAKAELMKMTQWEALILVFAYEWKVKARNLRWWGYFDVLPVNDEKFQSNQLIYWSPEEIRALHPSYVVDRIGHDSASTLYEKLLVSFEKYVGTVSKTEFHLLASVIMSYSFDVERNVEGKNEESEETEENEKNERQEDGEESEEVEEIKESEEIKGSEETAGPGGPGFASDDSVSGSEDDSDDENLVRNSDHLKSLVPLADTLNADTKKNNARLYMSGDDLVMRSTAAIAKGDQIYNIYSEHPNAEILRRYGYVEQQGSAYDFAEVSLETFKKYFAENSSLSRDFIEEILVILQEIEVEEDEKFVLDSYDCFATGEVIFELTFLTQLFVIIAAINHKKSFNSASPQVKARAIRRIYKKCYQLLESKKLTSKFMQDFASLLKVRLAEYPSKALNGFPPQKETMLTRSDMAAVVLASEGLSLKNCIDVDRVFTAGEQGYGIIADEKLLRNIMKKDAFEGTEPQPRKRAKRAKRN